MVEKIEINLIPAEYVVREKHFSINLSILIPVLISLGLICAAMIWLNIINSQIAQERVNIANLEREIEVNRTIQTEIRTLEGRQAEMRTKVEALKSINVNRAKWVDAFELYAEILPENTWLTSIEEAEGGLITINGMTEADAEVGLLMNRLSASPLVSNVNLVEIRDAGRHGELKNFTIQHSFVQSN